MWLRRDLSMNQLSDWQNFDVPRDLKTVYVYQYCGDKILAIRQSLSTLSWCWLDVGISATTLSTTSRAAICRQRRT